MTNCIGENESNPASSSWRFRRMSTWIVAVGASVFAGAMTSCSSSSTGPRLAGSYTLTTVGESALPAVIARTATRTNTGLSVRTDEVLSSELTLNVDGTFTNGMRVRITVDGIASESTTLANGLYVTRGDTLELRYVNGGPTELVIEEQGGTLRGLSTLGNRLVYRRIVPG